MKEQKSNSSEFKTLMEYAKEMHRRYFRAISAFYAFEALREVRAPNIVGRVDAEANAKIMTKYNGLFTPAEESLRVYFFLELAKMFDSSKQSLHLGKILNFTASNLKKLTAEAFKEYNQNQARTFIETLVKEYKGMNQGELIEIKRMINKHQATLDKLEIYRDKWLAHEDKRKPKVPKITGEEVRVLFDILARILNIITSRLNNESWTYTHVENSVKYDVKSVVDNLKKYKL